MVSHRDPLGQGQGVAAIQVHRIPVSEPVNDNGTLYGIN